MLKHIREYRIMYTSIVSVLLNLVLIYFLLFEITKSNDKLIVINSTKNCEPQIIEIYREPLTERELIDSYIKEISSMYSIDRYLVHSIIFHESTYNPNAKSTSNCLGLMQICPKWHMDRADRLNINNFYDPYSNILLGVDYISDLMNEADGDIAFMLMLYNMPHSEARKLYERGELTWYAESVIKRYEELKLGS
jgi:soluble lytic murein transglycosylase-like protein